MVGVSKTVFVFHEQMGKVILALICEKGQRIFPQPPEVLASPNPRTLIFPARVDSPGEHPLRQHTVGGPALPTVLLAGTAPPP